MKFAHLLAAFLHQSLHGSYTTALSRINLNLKFCEFNNQNCMKEILVGCNLLLLNCNLLLVVERVESDFADMTRGFRCTRGLKSPKQVFSSLFELKKSAFSKCRL